MPASPPPDVDLEQWRDSEAKILSWEPDTLFLTHFGPFNGARQHFHEMTSRLDEWSRAARRLVADEHLTEEQREQEVRRRGASRFEAHRRGRRRGTGTAVPGVSRIHGKVWRATGGSGKVEALPVAGSRVRRSSNREPPNREPATLDFHHCPGSGTSP